MDFKINVVKTNTTDLKYLKSKFKNRAKCNHMPFMGKSVLLARQADVTIMQHVNDSDVISRLVLEKFKNVLDYYHQRSWRRRSKYRFHKRENQHKQTKTENYMTKGIPEEFETKLISEMNPVFTGYLEEDKVEYDAQKFLHEALGDELNNYATSNSDTDTYKSNSVREHDENSSVGTSNISTLLSNSNSSYSHFSRKLLRRNTYASSSMYDKDGYQLCQTSDDDCKATEWINEAAMQHQIIVQTSKALNLCLNCKEFKHSVEYVEAEKILLLAIEKREAALKELKLMEYEDVREDCFCLGYIDLSRITVSLVNQNTVNSLKHWIFAVVSSGTQIFSTEIAEASHKDSITFQKSFKFIHLSSDFEIKIRLYTLKVLNKKTCNSDTINSETETTLCPTPNKLLSFYRSSGSKRPKQFYSYERRQPQFILHGTVIIHITELSQNNFLLHKVPDYSPLEGNINVEISSSIEFSESYSGFLTVGSETSELTTWNRRWCQLSGHLLEFWNYPQDQAFVKSVSNIDLRYCVIACISRVDRELCARPRTLLVETGSLSESETLLLLSQSSYKITRHYLSADCVEDMEAWEKRLNSVIFSLRNWNCMKYSLRSKN